MGGNIQLLKKRVFRWLNGYCLEEIKWAKGPYCRQYFGTAGFVFSLSARAPPARCVWRARHIFMLPITDFGSCNTYFGNHPSFLRKKDESAEGQIRIQGPFGYLNIFHCCLRGRSMHDSLTNYNADTWMLFVLGRNIQLFNASVTTHCSSDRWTMRACCLRGRSMHDHLTMPDTYVFMLLNLWSQCDTFGHLASFLETGLATGIIPLAKTLSSFRLIAS
jgi:hypothetical protein